jgi:hypothetical protein
MIDLSLYHTSLIYCHCFIIVFLCLAALIFFDLILVALAMLRYRLSNLRKEVNNRGKSKHSKRTD